MINLPEIETNGSISAEDAVAYSARIFQDQLGMFVNFDEPQEVIVRRNQVNLSLIKTYKKG